MVEGEGVLFQVKVMGTPTPKLTWYQNGEVVTADYSTELAKDGTLTLPSVENRHSGTYKLVAQNPAGKAEKEVRLFVQAEQTQQEQATVPSSTPEETIENMSYEDVCGQLLMNHSNTLNNYAKLFYFNFQPLTLCSFLKRLMWWRVRVCCSR